MNDHSSDQAAGLRALFATRLQPILAIHGTGGQVDQGTALAVQEVALQAPSVMLVDGRQGPASSRRVRAALRRGHGAELLIILADHRFGWLPLDEATHLVLAETSIAGVRGAFTRCGLLARSGARRILCVTRGSPDRRAALRFAQGLDAALQRHFGITPVWLGQLESPGFGAQVARALVTRHAETTPSAPGLVSGTPAPRNGSSMSHAA
ncbi:MAG: hypothetical protein EOM91_09395 [Sphingobacteriia bacterium]|nr:hypothetical protein [Sphingobacteriia bacterium]NCC38986.1 hypothetical protein [Gammaproteobacteria bacterium]